MNILARFTWVCIACGKMHYNDTHFRTHCRDEINCKARQELNYRGKIYRKM